MEKIKFNDLSGWLKALVIISWGYTALFAVAFLVGFIQAITQI